MDLSSFGILVHNSLRMHNIALEGHTYVKAHDASEEKSI